MEVAHHPFQQLYAGNPRKSKNSEDIIFQSEDQEKQSKADCF